MKIDKMYIQASFPLKRGMSFLSVKLILLLLLWIGLWQPASAQQPGTSAPVADAPLSTELVVHNLVQMNRYRSQALHAYRGTRVYRVEYSSILGHRSAEMVMSVKYLSPATKEFTVQSATGSKVIINKVLKKLLKAETKALDAKIQRCSALSENNYRFTMVGYESRPSGATYVLKVEPRTNDKYLYRGRIWVDAADYAVVRLEAEPAKNPSFWIKKAEIVQVYMKVSDFWLPAYNHSVAAIRLEGHAELTIDYKDYVIMGAGRVGSNRVLRSTPLAETVRSNAGSDVQVEPD